MERFNIVDVRAMIILTGALPKGIEWMDIAPMEPGALDNPRLWADAFIALNGAVYYDHERDTLFMLAAEKKCYATTSVHGEHGMPGHFIERTRASLMMKREDWGNYHGPAFDIGNAKEM